MYLDHFTYLCLAPKADNLGELVWKPFLIKKMKRVVVGSLQVWAITDTEIFKKSENKWKKFPGTLTDISVGVHSAWGVNKNGQIFRANQDENFKIQTGPQLIQVGSNL